MRAGIRKGRLLKESFTYSYRRKAIQVSISITTNQSITQSPNRSSLTHSFIHSKFAKIAHTFPFNSFTSGAQRVACNSHNRPIWRITNVPTVAKSRTCAKCVIKDSLGTRHSGIIDEFIPVKSHINATFADRHSVRPPTSRTMQKYIRAKNHLNVTSVRPHLPIVSHWNVIDESTKNTVNATPMNINLACVGGGGRANMCTNFGFFFYHIIP